jgi:uncharacterized protein YllA (UPF0747 family)
MSTGAVAVVTPVQPARARLALSAEPPLARLHDALLEDLARGGPLARERFAVRWADTAALAALGEAKRAPLPAPLAAAMREHHRRLGASAASLEALERLAAGGAVCTISGQQPAPLGGPLYSFHKIAAAVGMARRYEARTGRPCVAAFWMHGEDSDFDEIHSATIADASLSLHDLVLPKSAHPEGGMIGHVPIAPLAALEAKALVHWEGLPGAGATRELLARARNGAADLGDAMSALVLAAFGEEGVVVVDPRLPAFRDAARDVIERYLARADLTRDAARAGGDAIERLAGRRPLNDATLESFVFRIDGPARHKIDPAAARGAALTPNVALRAVVQDGVLPTVAMAVGPGEAGYLAQLREVFEGLGVRQACAVPRFAATWLPAAARELLEASGADPGALITATDAVIREHAESRVPGVVRDALDRAQAQALASIDEVAGRVSEVDASLPQMVGSARGKIDYQFQRLREGVVGKVRHQLERRHPEWLRLRYYLMPGDRPQERRIASLEPLAHRGPAAARIMCTLAEAHAAALEEGRLEHMVVDL